MKRIGIVVTLCALAAVAAQAVPSKRGLCYNGLTEAEFKKLVDGNVVWGYNWAPAENTDFINAEQGFAYMPMIWGAGDDFSKMRDEAAAYIASHKNVKYLLGFNEPMMTVRDGGCQLPPKDAAALWPQLEKIAEENGLALVSPALTWGYEKLSDGKIYNSPEAWMDEFIREYKRQFGREPRFDYLALHSYMDYPSAVMWFCVKYSEMYQRKVLLTEFCAWDSDPNQQPHQSLAAQVAAMTQKVEAMDYDDHVAGYAWFMSHGETAKVPYNSVFTKKGSDGSLTELGKVYLYMSDRNTERWYKKGERIAATDYVSSSNYNTTVGDKAEDGVRFNTPLTLESNADPESGADIPLQIGTFTTKRFMNYQIDMAKKGSYTLTLRYQSDKDQQLFVYDDGEEIVHTKLPASGSQWTTYSVPLTLKKGRQVLQLKSLGNAKNVKLVWLSIQ